MTPLPHGKSEPGLLDALLARFQAGEESVTKVFLPEDLADDDRQPDSSLAIAEGFEVSRKQSEIVGQDKVTWDERCLLVCSYNYQQSQQAGLERRLAKAEKALRQLTPARARGKRQFSDEKSL